MNATEATETFFAITKLWQSKDVTLRRLVYLAVKEMAKIADDVIIVTSRLNIHILKYTLAKCTFCVHVQLYMYI